jgi:hypothetical protein
MAKTNVLYSNGFFRLENQVACCSRLNGDLLRLLGLIMNRVNTAKSHGKFPSDVLMSRLLIKRVFGDCHDKTIKNYAEQLKQLGFIESFSKQNGENGDFLFVVTDRPENNPYVLLSLVENQLLMSTEVQRNYKADTVLEALTTAIKSVEDGYVFRLKNASESGRETILQEYSNYLREQLEATSMVCIESNQAETKVSKPFLKETPLPEDIQKWTLNDFANYFLQVYTRVTGKKHASNSRKTGKTVVDCINDLHHFYRDIESVECKSMMKKHIEAFFVNYPPSNKLTPTAFLMADPDALEYVRRFLETGEKHTPFEQHKRKTDDAANRAKAAREAKQEYKGIDPAKFIKMLRGNAEAV